MTPATSSARRPPALVARGLRRGARGTLAARDALARLAPDAAARRGAPHGRRGHHRGDRRRGAAVGPENLTDGRAVAAAGTYGATARWRPGVPVLMTRPPVAALQARLDAAAASTDRPTLADYRAEPWLAEAEAEALAAADEIVTPHFEIAGMFGDRAQLLDWRRPTPRQTPPVRGDVFAFPGPTVARKGAYEVRDAARRLGVRCGRSAPSWKGPASGPASSSRLRRRAAVARRRPRRRSSGPGGGRPATPARGAGRWRPGDRDGGLRPAAQPGLTLVPTDDVDALVAAMAAI